MYVKSEVQYLNLQISKSRWMDVYDILIIRFFSPFSHQFLERIFAFIAVIGLFAKLFLDFSFGEIHNFEVV